MTPYQRPLKKPSTNSASLCSRCFLPNSPTLFNAGARLGQLSACLVLLIEDTLAETPSGILPIVQKEALRFQTGGGVGINYSRFRPEGVYSYIIWRSGVRAGQLHVIVDKVADVIKRG